MGIDFKLLESQPYCMDEFRNMLKEAPNDIILVDKDDARAWTRAEVDDLSARVYHYLQKNGIGREDFVMICLPRGGLPIIAILGVMKAGAAFTIVESDYAAERIEYIKHDCGCKLIIDLKAWQDILTEEPLPGYVLPGLHDAAFAVYTSGSSGKPKGVLHEYGNIILEKLAAYGPNLKKPDRSTRTAVVVPLNFIAAIKMAMRILYLPLCLYIVPYSISKNPILLNNYFAEEKITYTFLSPSMIRALKSVVGSSLQLVHTGSEPANGIYLEGVRLVNNYSMSEAAFTLGQFVIDRPYDICPVGKPATDVIRVMLLDQDDKEVPVGETGEVCFENPFFRGYINLPEATAQAMRNGLFHSGDLGKRDENGNITITGRANDMIKINGNRIEPAEIEASFKRVTGKDWCAVRGFEKPGRSFICLYYTGQLNLDERTLRHEMSASLPYYMIPAHFMHVDAAPLLPNGKLDRKALPEPAVGQNRSVYAAPRTELESKLCQAFEKVLKISGVGINDSFYHLGGDSLGAMSLLAEVGLDDLNATDVFEGITPAGIAAIYEQKNGSSENDDAEAVEMRERQRAHVLTPNQRDIIDYGFFRASDAMWDIPLLYRFDQEIDAQKLCDALHEACVSRTALSTVFGFDEDGELMQRYDPSRALRISPVQTTEEDFSKIRKKLVYPFRIFGEPLIHAGVYITEAHVYLFLDVHHMVIDGMGLQLLFGDIAKAYRGEPLPLDTYYTYLAKQEQAQKSRRYQEAKDYYEKMYGHDDWCINLQPDTKEMPRGRSDIPIKRVVYHAEIEKFENRNHYSRNMMFTVLSLLALSCMERKNHVLVTWIYHDRSDAVNKNALGCLFRYIPVGTVIREDMMTNELFKEVSNRSSESLAHSNYEWSIFNDRIYENDPMGFLYETASIMSSGGLGSLGAVYCPLEAEFNANGKKLFLQAMHLKDHIVTNIVINDSIFSAEKKQRFNDVLSTILDRLLKWDAANDIPVSDLLKGLSSLD